MKKLTNAEEYLEWVKKIAIYLVRRYNMNRCDLDDYYAAGLVGLLEAWEKFDPERGLPLKHFAAPRVRGAIIDAMRGNSYLSVGAYRRLKASGSSSADIFAIRVQFDSSALPQFTIEKDPADIYEERSERATLRRRLDRLSNEEREILMAHYFDEKPLSQISREFGSGTRSWASRRHLKALAALRKEYAIDIVRADAATSKGYD